MGKAVRRLYEQFQPQHYKLTIDANPDTESFSGSVILSGHSTGRPSQRLTLHQKDLRITGAHVTFHDKKATDIVVEVDRINHHKSFDEVRLHTKTKLFPGRYTVRLEFEGKITRQMNGIYPCFFEHKGESKQLIATQFESHHAREVFPCIDEPEAKATFDLTLVTPDRVTAISNTPIKSQITKAGRQTTRFEITPHMSTYLLAFVFGELDYLEKKTRGGTTVRTYATPANAKLTEFALDTAVECLEFFNDYFGIDYPLDKCDLIALPDFASGAMENWGCITFREQTMLVDPKHSTLANKQYVALVVAHELAHQWFGNLVTMRWWTDLWLNEGFASWIEYLAIHQLYPEWNLWQQFAADEQQQALKLDALEHTHPIEVTVDHPDEIRSIFDAISYSKGASVIHMLHEYLGSGMFRMGLQHYLETHKYGNTDTTDLWASLAEISGKPVQEFMKAWTTQSGFPVVKALVEDDSIELSQQRFFINPQHVLLEAETWPVPLLSGDEELASTLKANQKQFPLKDTHLFKLNAGGSGFYRVAYNATHIERLGERISKGQLGPIDRLGILSDLFETAKAGQSDTLEALHFLEHYKNEDSYPVWDIISGALGNLRLVMNDEALREDIKPFIRDLVATQLVRLGWDRKPGESHFDRLLRPLILGMAASADDPTIVKRCRELFEKIHKTEDVAPDLRAGSSSAKVKRGSDIDPDLRGTVFGTVARLGGKADFEKLLALHNSSTLSEERTTLAAALTNFRQPELIQRALGLIDTDAVRVQDVSYWIAYSFLNRHAKLDTWEWLKQKWDWLHESMGADLSFYRMPIYSARVFSDESFITEYEKFFKPKLSPALDRSYRQGLEILQWQSAWKKRDLKEVRHFFQSPSSRA